MNAFTDSDFNTHADLHYSSPYFYFYVKRLFGNFEYLVKLESPYQALAIGTTYMVGSRMYITEIKRNSRTPYV